MSRIRIIIALIAGLLLAPRADAQQRGKPLFDRITAAMGGYDKILGVRTLVLEGTGENANFGQNLTPDAPLTNFAVTSYTRSIDFAAKRWQQDQTREPRFPAGNATPQRQRSAFDGVAGDIISDSVTRRGSLRAEIDRANEFFFHPIGFLQAAIQPATELTEEPRRNALRLLTMNAAGNKFAMLVDPATSLPVSVEKVVYHPMLGDVLLETSYSDWQMVDGVRIPMRIVQRMDKQNWSDMKFSAVRINADPGDISLPQSVKTSPPFEVRINVTVDSIAPGLWYLTGQSHHSLVIEMNDHLLLVEAPQSDARTLAVIEKARALRPNKPLNAVINTHHHFDHSGGIRAAMSEGLTIITHSGNASFYRDLAKRQHSIVKDALAGSKKTARIQGVTTRSVLKSGARTVELHEIRGSPHSQSMLVVYLPAEKLLIQADLYNSPTVDMRPLPPAPFVKGLVDNIDRLGLSVDRVVPIHGRIMSLSDLRSIAP